MISGYDEKIANNCDKPVQETSQHNIVFPMEIFLIKEMNHNKMEYGKRAFMVSKRRCYKTE